MKNLLSALILVSTLIFSVNINAEPITVPMVIVSIEVDQQPTSSVGFSIPFTDNSWDLVDPFPDIQGLISIPAIDGCTYRSRFLTKDEEIVNVMIGKAMPSRYNSVEEMSREGLSNDGRERNIYRKLAMINLALFDAFITYYNKNETYAVCDAVLHYANDYIISKEKGIENLSEGYFKDIYHPENKGNVYKTLPWSTGTVKNKSLKNSYKITRIYKNVKLKTGDRLFFHFEDEDEMTNDMIGKGELIFNGDQILEGRIGSMDVKVEFVFN